VSDQRHNFVGRTRELAEMRAALDDALAGRGGLLLLSGEPGIGKTSLADIIATDAAARGALVAWGRCWEGGGAPAYWPWIAVIRACLRDRDPNELDAILGSSRPHLAPLLPELRGPAAASEEIEQDPTLSGLGSGEPDDQRFRLFDTTSSLLANLARDRPLVLVLDDCHAADPASLLLLRFVARDLRRSPLLLIVTYREVEISRDAKLAELMADLGREGTRIALRGLSIGDVAEFVAASAGTRPSQRTIERLMGATEGNPFFVSEIVRLLIAERHLGQDDAEDLGSFRIPDSIRVAIRRGVALFSEQARNALTVASVAGREFDLAVIRDACGLPIENLIAALDEAEARGLVSKVADSIGRYRFVHALIPETLSDDLSRQDARELHLRIARTIEKLQAGALEPQLEKLAYHYHAALPLSPLDKAISYAQRGAQNARALLAYEDAARLYEMAIHALEMSQPVDELLRCELLLSMGDALFGAGLFNRTRAAFERAARSAKAAGSAVHLARAAIGFGLPPSTPGIIDHTLISLLDEARQALGQNDSGLLAMVQARMASEYFWAHDSRRNELARQALEIARRVNDPFALLYVLFTRHTAVWEPDNLEERLATSAEIIRLAEDTGNRTWALRARYMRFADLLELGDIPAVDSEIEQYAELAAQLRQHLGYEHLARATRALMDGRFEDAERLSNQTLEVAGRLERRTRPFRQAVNAQMLVLRREQGRLHEIEPFFRARNARLRRSALAMCAMAFCYSELGRRNDARAIFEELAAGDFHSLPRDMGWYAMLVQLSEVCFALDDSARAAVLYRLLAPHEARNAVLDIHVCYGSVAHYLGELSVTMGELDRAQAHFETALGFNLRMGARPWVARTRYHYAAMLVERGNPGDREKAIELAALAQSGAESVGMKALAEQIRELRGIDLRAEAAPDGTVTILFTDIENSTPITERLGDLRAQELLHVHNAIIREQIAAHKGFEVKSMGDGFMIAFPSARRALLCAIEIQRAFAAYSAAHPDAPLRVSIGIHTGEAIKEVGDFYGKAVIIASRIGAHARGGEILVSSTLKDLTEHTGDLRFDTGREVELKGLTGIHRLYSVNWQEASVR
jgi:class 3 adenylate cyclase